MTGIRKCEYIFSRTFWSHSVWGTEGVAVKDRKRKSEKVDHLNSSSKRILLQGDFSYMACSQPEPQRKMCDFYADYIEALRYKVAYLGLSGWKQNHACEFNI